MSEELEQQTDEIEALISIYEGDAFFKQLSSTSFQYKYGEDDNSAFIVQITWGEKYPNEMPKIEMDTFFNRSMSPTLKSKISDLLTTEAENWLGCGMTYTLFESIKEHQAGLLEELEEDKKNKLNSVAENVKTMHLAPVIKTASASDNLEPTQKKEQLTKSQKRRMWERTDNKGQLQRGWNWVDIIRHLSQTANSKDEPLGTVANTNISQTVLAPPPNNY